MYRTMIYDERGIPRGFKDHETEEAAWEEAANVLARPLFAGCRVEMYGPVQGDARKHLMTLRAEEVQS